MGTLARPLLWAALLPALFLLLAAGTARAEPSSSAQPKEIVFFCSPEIASRLQAAKVTMTPQTINRLYLGSPVEYEFEGNASRLLPTDYKELLSQRERMIEDFLEMRPKQYVQHWVQEIFRGATVLRPAIVETVEEMISFVRQSRGRLGQVGYVFDTDLPQRGPQDVKILLTVPLKGAVNPPSK